MAIDGCNLNKKHRLSPGMKTPLKQVSCCWCFHLAEINCLSYVTTMVVGDDANDNDDDANDNGDGGC